jgi:hypothetical protein
MEIADVIKNQKELAQTYLIITSLVATLKPNNAPINITVINIAQDVFLNIAFYGFIFSILLYYVLIPYSEDPKKKKLTSISSKMIAVLFTSIICICLVEPIISSYVNLTLSY